MEVTGSQAADAPARQLGRGEGEKGREERGRGGRRGSGGGRRDREGGESEGGTKGKGDWEPYMFKGPYEQQ